MSPLIIEVGKDPQNLILSSNGHFAWCLAVLDKTVERFTIGADGSLKRLPLALEATTIRKNEFVEILGYHPSCLVVTPNGKYAFVARPRYNSIAQFKIQPDGAFVLNNTFSIPGAGDPSLLRLDPNGKYLIATNPDNELISLYSIGGDGLLSAANPSNINASQHLIDLTLAVKR
jgi:6-phosphogluconolactonase (cycloisomerase 2 family)